MMLLGLFAQIPGTDVAIRSAEASGWTAVLVCITFIALVVLISWLVRKIIADKDKLGDRMTVLEDYQKKDMAEMHDRTTLACNTATQACQEVTTAVQGLSKALAARPCLLTTDDQK